MSKNYKTMRKQEFYVHRVIRETDSEETTEKETKYAVSPLYGKQTDRMKGESIGYHKDPSCYDSIRPGYKVDPKQYSVGGNPNVSLKEEAVVPNNRYQEEEIVEIYDAYEESNVENDIDDLPEEVWEETIPSGRNQSMVTNVPDTPMVSPRKTAEMLISEEPKQTMPQRAVAQTQNISKPLRRTSKYTPPKMEFLLHDIKSNDEDKNEAERQRKIIDQTLKESNIRASVSEYIFGPTVTQFLIKVEPGVNVKTINSCEANLAMYLEAERIRIQTPIPGIAFAGIEVPKKLENRRNVYLGNLLNSPQFLKSKMILPVAVGQDNYGKYMYIDLAEMPHGLVAGTTKSGKSVCLNAILISLLYKFSPNELRLVLIDPKRIELGIYEGIPHLAMPVIIDQEDFAGALGWVVEEMDHRYEIFGEYGEREIKDLNLRLATEKKPIMPYILVIMDEFSDWISGAGQDIELMLQRIAQKARSAGIHIILAAQRPSKDVIKGSIKANFDTRLAFKVASFDDAKVILGGSGAEKLEGRGDMLIRYAGNSEKRLQGAFVDNGDIKRIIHFLKENNPCDYIVTKEELRQSTTVRQAASARGVGREDERFEEVAYYVVRNQVGSNNQIMQIFGMGFNRVNDIFAALEELEVVGPSMKGKQRDVLVDEYQLTEILENE